jgi:hypothetical protein
VENVPGLGLVPLIPCYLNSNSVNTIPHCFRAKIPREAVVDSRPDSGTWSSLRHFEINMWMWPQQAEPSGGGRAGRAGGGATYQAGAAAA